MHVSLSQFMIGFSQWRFTGPSMETAIYQTRMFSVESPKSSKAPSEVMGKLASAVNSRRGIPDLKSIGRVNRVEDTSISDVVDAVTIGRKAGNGRDDAYCDFSLQQRRIIITVWFHACKMYHLRHHHTHNGGVFHVVHSRCIRRNLEQRVPRPKSVPPSCVTPKVTTVQAMSLLREKHQYICRLIAANSTGVVERHSRARNSSNYFN